MDFRYSRNRTPYHILFFFTINGGQISSYSSTKLLRFKPCFLLLWSWKRLKRAFWNQTKQTIQITRSRNISYPKAIYLQLTCSVGIRETEYRVYKHSPLWNTHLVWVSLSQVSKLTQVSIADTSICCKTTAKRKALWLLKEWEIQSLKNGKFSLQRMWS